MTIPQDHNLPLDKEAGSSEVLQSIDEMYRTISTGLNGQYLSSEEEKPHLWKPELKGSTASGTFTYVDQFGYVYRQGAMVDCWFSLEWSAQSGATGNLQLIAPYRATKSLGTLFSGNANLANLSWGVGNTTTNCVILSNSFNIQFNAYTSSAAESTIGVANSGNIIGNIRYVGVLDDRES